MTETAQNLRPVLPSGGAALEFDFPGLRIGVAEYEEGPTGCTVFDFGKRGVTAAADVRGGSPGALFHDFGFFQALCFAGGSLLGIQAATGVAAAMFAERGHDHVEWTDVPVVAGAICFDFDRPTGVFPDAALGAAAYRAAQEGTFPLGAVGAGRYTSVGKALPGTVSEPAGQGAAIRAVGEAKVFICTVLNSVGAVLARDGRVLRGHLDQATGRRLRAVDQLAAGAPVVGSPGNTTLTLLVTNQKLSGRDLTQVSRQVHSSMARAIEPFHAPTDGDVLFAATTNAVSEPALADPSMLAAVAAEVAWDAILSVDEHAPRAR
jgi:L-aminopeptidase/D-esterase-like protein